MVLLLSITGGSDADCMWLEGRCDGDCVEAVEEYVTPEGSVKLLKLKLCDAKRALETTDTSSYHRVCV